MRKEFEEEDQDGDNRLVIAFTLVGMVAAVIIFAFALSALFRMWRNYHSVSAEASAREPIPVEEILEHEKAYNREVREWKEKSAELNRQIPTEETVSYLIEITDEEIDLMARVVMSEASTLSFDAKQAIAQTIVNRVRDENDEFRNQTTVTEVVTKPYQYSTQDNGEPDQDCYDAVYQALTYKSFPIDMFWFREDHYHRFGEPYIHIGTTYFSRSGKYD